MATFSPLPPHAVVVGVGSITGPAADRQPGDPGLGTSVAGRAAVISTDKPGDCGGDETMTVWIPDLTGGEHYHYRLDACLRGPDLAAGEQTVQALLASASFVGS